MIETYKNPQQIILQANILDFEGNAKGNVVSAIVRVFHVLSDGTEVNNLTATPLNRIGASSAWRYVWVSPP